MIAKDSTGKEDAEVYLHIILLHSLMKFSKTRNLEEGQPLTANTFKLIASCAISEPNLKSTLQPFANVYANHLPSKHTVNAELDT